MAKLTSSLFLVLLLVLSMTAFLAQAAPFEQVGSKKIIQLNYYLIEITSGPNATLVSVAGIAGKLWAPNTFGTIFVGDNLLTEGPSTSSPKVGQVRGLVVVSSKDGSANYISSSITFTNREYNGSTLQVQGTFNRNSRQPSLLSIIGGTGKFEGAKGSAFLQTYSSSITMSITRIIYKIELYK
ncbi:hypothetical protein M0R45_032920 [Rubus argutus]|uniref:Dirigent protein n=1 Tax=Rubus argutus TaxID=59490 RepID=A0AAW1WIH0_RUBAR